MPSCLRPLRVISQRQRAGSGNGLKEEVYEASLVVELGLRGLKCKRQVPVHVEYKGVNVDDNDHPKRIDMIVEDVVGVECKAVSTGYNPIFRAQCLTYLKMLGLRTGLVINFGMITLREGIKRVTNESRKEYLKRLEKENPAGLRMLLSEEKEH